MNDPSAGRAPLAGATDRIERADALGANAYASLDSLYGLPPATEAVAGRRARAWSQLQLFYPGALVAVTIGGAAEWLSERYATPVMLFALLIGMAFNFLREDQRFAPGIALCSKTVLRTGIALLGIRITLNQLAGLGLFPILLVIAAIATTLIFGVLLAKLLRLDRNFGLLSAGAVGICGASAALAISAILPRGAKVERDTILAVITVTALSTVAMIVYPQIAMEFHLSETEAGIFLGGTIHDVAQVVGAGFSMSHKTGDISTYVKLLRVIMLIPVISIIALLIGSQKHGEGRSSPPFPRFLLGFAVMVLVASFLPVPQFAAKGISMASQFCLVTAMAAVGMSSSLRDVVMVGWRPIALVIAETAWIAVFTLTAILFLH